MFRRILFLFPLLLPAAAPPAPTGLEASDRSFNTQINLSWDHLRGASIYRVFRAPTTNFGDAFSIGITESIVFTDVTGLGETHFYWVRAENSDGAGPPAGPVRGVTATNNTLPVLININSPPPPPTANPSTGAKVYLGKTLFWDEQLSSTRTTACGTCHRFRAGGTDPRAILGDPTTTHPGRDRIGGTDDDVTGSRGIPLSGSDGLYRWSDLFGIREQVTERRASNILDVNIAPQGILWDGKAQPRFSDPETGAPLLTINAAAESQAMLPFLNTAEMGHEGRTLADVAARVAASRPLALSPSIPEPLARWIGNRTYPELFEEAFGSPAITPSRMAMAIATYERSLQADRVPPSPLTTGFQAFLTGACSSCHTLGPFTNGSFQATGVRPPEDDPGRGGITGIELETGRFRIPGLRGVGLRTVLQHNGRFTTLRDVIEFYNRGGDFPGPRIAPQIRQLNLTEEQKQGLESFLHNSTADPRLANETGPIFERPMLYSESARVPTIADAGRAASNGRIPAPIALEPPFAGNPSFVLALDNVAPAVPAVLAVHSSDPGTGQPPANASFARRELTTSDSGTGQGFASVSLSIPADAAGTTLFARWYVEGGVSPLIRFTVFSTDRPDVPGLFSLSAASLTKGFVAPDSLVSTFGSDLAGATLEVIDGAGARLTPTILFGGDTQINFQLPSNASPGEATLQAVRGGTIVAEGKLQVAAIAPGIFTSNADGRDVPAALFFRSRPGNPLPARPAWRFDSISGRSVPDPVDLGQESDLTALVLYGTGLRSGKDVRVTIGGIDAPVAFAGAQSEFAGLDQINVDIPRALAGRGEVGVQVIVDGIRANPVRVAFR